MQFTRNISSVVGAVRAAMGRLAGLSAEHATDAGERKTPYKRAVKPAVMGSDSRAAALNISPALVATDVLERLSYYFVQPIVSIGRMLGSVFRMSDSGGTASRSPAASSSGSRLHRLVPWRGHPKGLRPVFSIESCERYAFYGMRALLVPFLTAAVTEGGLGLAEPQALTIYAIFTALVYLTPLIGGALSDRYLGQRTAVLIGGLTMAIGEFALMFKGMLFFGLAMIIIGNGFFKPNMSTIVGQLYRSDDKRRDGGYTVFYMGINLGAAFAPMVCGFLAHNTPLGWAAGFASPGIFMLIGLIWFWRSQKALAGPDGEALGLPPGRDPIKNNSLNAGDKQRIALYTAALTALALLAWVVKPLLNYLWSPHWLFGGLFGSGVSAELKDIAYLFVWRLPVIFLLLYVFNRLADRGAKDHGKLSSQERRGLLMVGVTTMAIFLWCVGFEQAGGTLNIFARDKTNCSLFGYEFPAEWFQSVNPYFILLIAGAFERIWNKLGGRLSTMQKQGIGLLIMSLSFLVMMGAQSSVNSREASDAGQNAAAAGLTLAGAGLGVSPLWLLATYFFATCGELCLSPIGLSTVQKYAPRRMVSLLMGVFFLGIFAGNSVAGVLKYALQGKIDLWSFLCYSMAICGLLYLAAAPFIRRIVDGK